eukprot:tig00001542_g9321.t1
MASSDAAVGVLLLVVAIVVWVYYTLWVLVTPFVAESHAYLLDYFPDRYYAVAVPAALLVVLFTGVGLFVSLSIIKSGQKKKAA